MSDQETVSLLREIHHLSDRQRHHAAALLSAAEAHARAGDDLARLVRTRGEIDALLRLLVADLAQEEQAMADLVAAIQP